EVGRRRGLEGARTRRGGKNAWCLCRGGFGPGHSRRWRLRGRRLPRGDLLGRGLPGLDPLFRGLSCRCLRDLLSRGAAALGGDLSLGRGFLARASRLRSSLLPGRFLLRHRPPPPNLGKRRHYSILRTPCDAVSPVAAVSRSHAASAPMTATSSSPKAAPPPT